MKRKELIRYISNLGCKFFREGSNHSIYWNPQNNRTTAIPRHTEIDEKLSIKICKDLGIKLNK